MPSVFAEVAGVPGRPSHRRRGCRPSSGRGISCSVLTFFGAAVLLFGVVLGCVRSDGSKYATDFARIMLCQRRMNTCDARGELL